MYFSGYKGDNHRNISPKENSNNKHWERANLNLLCQIVRASEHQKSVVYAVNNCFLHILIAWQMEAGFQVISKMFQNSKRSSNLNRFVNDLICLNDYIVLKDNTLYSKLCK